MYAKSAAPGRYGDHRGRGVVRPGRDHRQRPARPGPGQPAQARLRGQLPPQGPDDAAGLAQRREQPGGQAGPADQVPGPVPGPGVVQLRGRRVRHLGADLPGQPVGEQVGDQQQGPRRGQLRRPRCRGQLVDRVDGHLLDPGDRVQIGGRDLGQHLAHHAVGPGVPVVHRVAEQRPARVEQAVVHTPRVDAHAGQVEGPRRRTQAIQHPAVQPEDVPVQCAQHPDRRVREPVRLVQIELAMTDLADHDPAAGRAQVHGGDRRRPVPPPPPPTLRPSS